MSEELNLILITAVVNGVIIFLFNTVINQIVKKLDNRYDYMKTVIMPYCDKLYEIYRLLHVDMEPCISKHQECDEVEILKITEKSICKTVGTGYLLRHLPTCIGEGLYQKAAGENKKLAV